MRSSAVESGRYSVAEFESGSEEGDLIAANGLQEDSSMVCRQIEASEDDLVCAGFVHL